MAGVAVHGGDGEGHVFIGEGGEPATAGAGRVGEVEAQGLDEHHVGELLGDERAAGLGVAEFVAHAFEGPAHGGFVGLALDVDDGGQRLQKQLGVAAGEGEEASGHVARAFGELGDLVGLVEAFEYEGVVDGLECEVCGEVEGEAARKDKAIAGFEADGAGDGLYDQPTGSGEHGIALDALVFGEVDGKVAGHGEATGGEALGLEQGEDFGERIHALGGVDRGLDGRGLVSLGVECWVWQDVWTNHTDFQYRSSGGRGASSIRRRKWPQVVKILRRHHHAYFCYWSNGIYWIGAGA